MIRKMMLTTTSSLKMVWADNMHQTFPLLRNHHLHSLPIVGDILRGHNLRKILDQLGIPQELQVLDVGDQDVLVRSLISI